MGRMYIRSLFLIVAIAGCGGDGTASCDVAADCGQNSECVEYSCNGGSCSSQFTAAGFVVAGQSSGDCQELRCDGAGGIASAAIDDVADDQNPCTIEGCAAGAPTVGFASAQTACGIGLSCDGAGHCVECTTATQCPGTDDECQMRVCSSAGVCGMTFTTAGTPRTQQTAGDCQRAVCDGAGGSISVMDNNDVPADEGNVCTSEVCTQGTPGHTNVAIGTSCGAGLKCDADANCVACLADNECPATGNECVLPDCSAQGTCGTSFAVGGTALTSQTAGDCKTAVCDGAGGTMSANNDSDLPADDGNPCTSQACQQGSAIYEPLPTGTVCGTSMQCDGTGNCVACLFDTDCPPTGSECVLPDCGADGTCGTTFAPTGTVLSQQTPGDCKRAICDGLGGPTTTPDDADIPPDDGNPCTTEVCVQGSPATNFVPDGTSCGPGRTCSSGTCI